MHDSIRRFGLVPLALLFVSSVAPAASEAERVTVVTDAPITSALVGLDADVKRYNDHLTTLASPYMGGRVPGSDGMERAKDYAEYWFKEFGLQPAFEDENGEPSFRQPLELGGTTELKTAKAEFDFGLRDVELKQDRDFIATGLGDSGKVEGEMVFVGYSIDDGPDNYSNYEGLDDLDGKVAVMFRFEPMDEEGQSRFQDGRGWSSRAGFSRKLRACFDRGAAGAIIINPPGSSDGRAAQLVSPGGGGGGTGPVMLLSQKGGEKLVKRADPRGRSLMELREWADENGGWIEFEGDATLEAKFERTPLIAENVGGLIPGRGDLADELIVIGAHLDHLGMGYFGSRSGPGELHPGADDNASGSSGVLLLAESLSKAYAELPDDANARTIMLVCFTGEESGLNGSRYLANNPIRPIEDHMLMINFDMIGRIQNGRLSVSGMNTGEGLLEFCQPFFDASGLEVVTPERMDGASDHTSFYDQEVPVLFGIIADFHSDYHTPNDTSDKINRVGATMTARMFHEIAMAAAQRPERFEFSEEARRAQRGPSRMDIKVRFGVQPGYVEDEMGVAIEAITPDSSAEEAGVQAGDRLVRWDGQKIEDIGAWMTMLAKHEPGDVVKVGVVRDGEEITLEVTLQGR